MPATDSPAVLVDIACDYLLAAIGGEPLFASTVADNYGTHRVSRGMATLLTYLVIDAAGHNETDPKSIIETMRVTYARPLPDGNPA